MRASTHRLTATAESLLAPGESLETTGIGWAAQTRPKVPLLFLGRRQHWFALTDRRMLVFARHWGGPRADDLVLGKRYSSFMLEKVHPHRLLFQLRIRGTNDARLVFEFRPGHRALGTELVAHLTRALPAPETVTPTPGDAGTAAAFWGDH